MQPSIKTLTFALVLSFFAALSVTAAKAGEVQFVSFVEGDPAEPGDGVVVSAQSGQYVVTFEVSPESRIAAVAEGLTIAAYPESGVTASSIQPYFAPQGMGFGSCAVIPGGSQTTYLTPEVNGVHGFAINISQSAFQFQADVLSSRPGCGSVSLEDLELIGVEAFIPNPFSPLLVLDALAVGIGIDTDNDGVSNGFDNCLIAANADQRDTNADGFGNLCDPDLNNDCAVNFEDLSLLKAVFFGTDADADFDGDGGVNFSDLAVMKEGFFGPPGPSGLVTNCP